MGTIAASVIIAQASEVAQDTGNITFTVPQALSWLNEGVLRISLKKYNAAVWIAAKQLVPGTLQSAAGHELLSVNRNMGANGMTPGKAIMYFDRDSKDAANPNWHMATPSTVIREYCWHIDNPKLFYVSPPVPTTPAVWVETMESIDLGTLTDQSQMIPVDNIFSSVLVDWILWRWFARDGEVTPNFDRAKTHYGMFESAIDNLMKAEAQSSPVVRIKGEEQQAPGQ